MHGNDRARARRDRRLDARRVDVVRGLIGLDRHGPCADVARGEPRGDVGVRGHDDLVARTDLPCAQRERERIEAARHADAVAGATEFRELAFEALDLRSADERGLRQRVPEHGHEFVRQLQMRGHQIEKRNFRWISHSLTFSPL